MSANNFRLTLDTIAPAGSITSPAPSVAITNIKNTIDVGINKGDATYMKFWVDHVSNTSSAPQDTDWELAVSTKTVNFEADGDWYAHVILLDDVGNSATAAHSGLIRSDTQAPAIANNTYAYDLDSSSHTYTNDATFGIHIEADDTGTTKSGLDYVTISGPIEGSPVTVSANSFVSGVYQGQLTFATGTTGGEKTFTITAYDKSGNSASKTVSITYDPGISAATLTLKATAASADPLQQYINASNNSFVAVIDTTDTDIKYYQLYGDLTGTAVTTSTTWKDWPTAGATSATFSSLAFTTTDGTKHVYMRVKDAAGNIYPAMTDDPVTATRTYDATVPALTLTRDDEWIANGNGSKNSTTIHYTAADATSGLATGSPSFTCNGTTVTGVSGGSFTFSHNTAGAQVGANTIRISATDNAGNSTYTEVVVNIEGAFSIDSLALGGHTLVQGYYNDTSKANITVTVNNATAPTSGRDQLYVWTDTVADNTTVPGSYAGVDWTSAAQTVASADITKSFAYSNANYLHVKAVSNVGNVAYKHIQFSVDKTAPTIVATAPAHVKTLSQTITVTSVSDNEGGSGLHSYKLEAGTGTTVASGTFDWNTSVQAGDLPVALDSATTSGDYSIILTVRDKAGNTSTTTVTWEYDAVPPQGSITLKKTDGTTAKENPSAENAFKACILYTVDSTISDPSEVSYKIWGDFSTTSGGSATSEQDAQWVPMSVNPTITDTLYCTDNPAGSPATGVEKKVYCKLKDNAGWETTLTFTSFVYNPNAAELTISGVNHARISCTHVLRLTSSGSTVSPVANDYADMMNFTVTSNQTITEWKVAAYTTYPAASTSGSTVTPITKLDGSYSTTGYTSGGTVSVLTWNVIVDGRDFRNAVGGSASVNVDGTHYIVVFGKNEAGTWTLAGTPAELDSNN